MTQRTLLWRVDKTIGAIAQKIADVTLIICNIMLIIVTVEIIVGVFFRYVLRDPLYWSEEVARYFLLWIAMLGASVVTQRREHLRLDSFIERMSDSFQRGVEAILGILVVTMLLLVFPWLWRMLTGPALTTLSPAMRIPMIIPQSSLGAGFVLLIFHTIINVIRDILWFFIGNSTPTETV